MGDVPGGRQCGWEPAGSPAGPARNLAAWGGVGVRLQRQGYSLTESFLCAQTSAKHLTCVNSFNPHDPRIRELSLDLEPGCVKYTMWRVNVPYIKARKAKPHEWCDSLPGHGDQFCSRVDLGRMTPLSATPRSLPSLERNIRSRTHA